MLLKYRQFFIKERVAMVKLTDTYDVFDPVSNQQIAIARDEPASWAKILRLLVNKRFLPTQVNIYEDEDQGPIFSLIKKPGFLRINVLVADATGQVFGQMQSKLFSLGGGFKVMDASGSLIADVKGDWKGWNFRFLSLDGFELGVVSKKWAGLGKEFFTSADNYMIALNEDSGYSLDEATVSMLLAAGLAIDLVFKEQG
jgi:uncharacterized protein YxjI